MVKTSCSQSHSPYELLESESSFLHTRETCPFSRSLAETGVTLETSLPPPPPQPPFSPAPGDTAGYVLWRRFLLCLGSSWWCSMGCHQSSWQCAHNTQRIGTTLLWHCYELSPCCLSLMILQQGLGRRLLEFFWLNLIVWEK